MQPFSDLSSTGLMSLCYCIYFLRPPPTWRARFLHLFPQDQGSPVIPAGIEFVKVKVTLRPTVSRPVRLGVRHPSGTRDQFFFLLESFFRQLRVCYFVAPSLTRRRVCNLLLLLVLARALGLLGCSSSCIATDGQSARNTSCRLLTMPSSNSNDRQTELSIQLWLWLILRVYAII
jgi:hypothetical protein